MTPEAINKKCEICGKPIPRKHSRFCSKECKAKGMRVDKVCIICGREYSVPMCRSKTAKYCSQSCKLEGSKTANDSTTYKGIRYHLDPSGYYVNSNNLTKLHRVIWAEYFGPIPINCVVHHKDGNKKNNKIDNLTTVDWGEHTRMHHTGLKRPGISAHRRRNEFGRFIPNNQL